MVKYYPLIDANDDGTEKVALFYTNSMADALRRNLFALESVVPRYYRLITLENCFVHEYPSYTIHCPLCGAAMELRRPHKDAVTLGEYSCEHYKL